MTPAQQSQITALRAKITRMREGGAQDATIRAGLIAEGWAAGAVIEAMQASPMTRPSNTLHDT